jgi:deoxyxylulose-5-phosphate synthase
MGKGVSIMHDSYQWHGNPPNEEQAIKALEELGEIVELFSLIEGNNMKKYEIKGNKPTRHGFGEGLAELGERYDNVVVIGTDVTGSVLTSFFKEKFPDRFFSIGIAEQNATTQLQQDWHYPGKSLFLQATVHLLHLEILIC